MMSDGQRLKSRLMVGGVGHCRYAPLHHSLYQQLFMPAIDLDEIDQLEQSVWLFGTRWWHWARFNRSDYLGQGDLKQAVLDKVIELKGIKLTEARVMLVCHLRYLGLYFSPVNFYYIYDDQDRWRYMLAEVSNTPWNERHYYLIDTRLSDDEVTFSHDKAFHVSPFNPITQRYRWRIKPFNQRLFVQIECYRGEKEFSATVDMQEVPFSSKRLLAELVKVPVMTIKVITGIYWHAFKLWRKGAPIYDHPNR
jgi:DUF1365 family protein